MNLRSTEFQLGTSGFSFPHWRGVFYPQGLPMREWLRHYAEHFQSVEINMTFYRAPDRAMLEKWLTQVPEDFQFTLNASQLVTHLHELKYTEELLMQIWREYAPLGKRLSCILFQLPPSLHANATLLRHFLGDLQRSKRDWPALGIVPRIAIEFRHPSWYVPDTFSMLRSSGIAPVLHDMPWGGGWSALSSMQGDIVFENAQRRMSADEWLDICRDSFLYLRFHGTVEGEDRKEYKPEHLELWAAFTRQVMKEHIPVHAYFKNDIGGAAARNALQFASMVGLPMPRLASMRGVVPMSIFDR